MSDGSSLKRFEDPSGAESAEPPSEGFASRW